MGSGAATWRTKGIAGLINNRRSGSNQKGCPPPGSSWSQPPRPRPQNRVICVHIHTTYSTHTTLTPTNSPPTTSILTTHPCNGFSSVNHEPYGTMVQLNPWRSRRRSFLIKNIFFCTMYFSNTPLPSQHGSDQGTIALKKT